MCDAFPGPTSPVTSPLPRLHALALGIALVIPVALHAQCAQGTQAPHGNDGGVLDVAADSAALPPGDCPKIPTITKGERVVIQATAAGTVVAAFADTRLRAALRAPDPAPHNARSVLFSEARVAGSPGIFLGALALYVTGRVSGHSSVADVGLHSAEAIVVSGAFTHLLKGAVGRQRPYASEGHPARFEPGRGFMDGSHASFPSGHTSASFAMAAVLTSEVARRQPAHRWRSLVVGSLAYGSAAMIGLSRVYHDAHWGSDVVAGAGLGTLSGMMIARRAHAVGRDRGRLERWLLGSP